MVEEFRWVEAYKLVKQWLDGGRISEGVRKQPPKEIVRQVFERDKHCRVCGKNGEVVHHIIDPASTSLDNLVLVCRSCHSRIHDLMAFLDENEDLIPAFDWLIKELPEQPVVRDGTITFYTCKYCGFRVISESDFNAHSEACRQHPEWEEEYRIKLLREEWHRIRGYYPYDKVREKYRCDCGHESDTERNALMHYFWCRRRGRISESGIKPRKDSLEEWIVLQE